MVLDTKGEYFIIKRIASCGGCQCLGAVPDRREDKERKGIDNLTTPEPSWYCQNLCFDLPTGEGAPFGKKGVGGIDLLKSFWVCLFSKRQGLNY